MSVLNKILMGALAIFIVSATLFTWYMINKEPAKMEPIYEKADYGDIITGSREDKRVKDDVKGFVSLWDSLFDNPIAVDWNVGTISGLKDKAVEKKINTEINKDRVSNGNSWGITNVSDILCVAHQDSNYKIVKYSNFRLDTGERLKFEDIFTKDADITQFLVTGIYRTLIHDMCPYDQRFAGKNCSETDTAKFDYTAIEEETFRLVNYYKMNGIKEFGIERGYIYFQIENDTWFKTYIGDHYQDVALYNRFKSKTSLYEKPIDNKNCSNVFGRQSCSALKKINDNVYVDISRFFVTNAMELRINTAINSVANMVTKNTNKAYYLSGVADGEGADGGLVTLTLLEADRDYFIKNIDRLIIEVYMHENDPRFGNSGNDITRYDSNFKKVNIQY